jgi:hypothetical protein
MTSPRVRHVLEESAEAFSPPHARARSDAAGRRPQVRNAVALFYNGTGDVPCFYNPDGPAAAAAAAAEHPRAGGMGGAALRMTARARALRRRQAAAAAAAAAGPRYSIPQCPPYLVQQYVQYVSVPTPPRPVSLAVHQYVDPV